MISNRLLATITDSDIGLTAVPFSVPEKTRTGARAILFDANSRVALVYERTYKHYKLPGGNVEDHEDTLNTVIREVHEEVGASIKNIRYIGKVDSYLSVYKELCTQHYYYAEIKGDIEDSSWIDEEELHGCEIVWCDNLQQAIQKIKSTNSPEYVHKFERARELAGLRGVQNILASKG